MPTTFKWWLSSISRHLLSGLHSIHHTVYAAPHIYHISHTHLRHHASYTHLIYTPPTLCLIHHTTYTHLSHHTTYTHLIHHTTHTTSPTLHHTTLAPHPVAFVAKRFSAHQRLYALLPPNLQMLCSSSLSDPCLELTQLPSHAGPRQAALPPLSGVFFCLWGWCSPNKL